MQGAHPNTDNHTNMESNTLMVKGVQPHPDIDTSHSQTHNQSMCTTNASQKRQKKNDHVQQGGPVV